MDPEMIKIQLEHAMLKEAIVPMLLKLLRATTAGDPDLAPRVKSIEDQLKEKLGIEVFE